MRAGATAGDRRRAEGRTMIVTQANPARRAAAPGETDPGGWGDCRFLTCSVLPVRRACNLRCPFCFSRSSVSALDRERSDWQRLDVASYYAFARGRSASRLVITG